MKKMRYLFIFSLCISLFSCEQELITEENWKDEENILKTRRDFLYDLMEIGNYHVEEEKIKEDLATMLVEINDSYEVRAVSTIPIVEKIYESPLVESEISLFSTDEINDFEGEKTRLFVYKLQNEEKSGFAITCNDLRIGEILAIIEEGEFKKDITKEPFLQIIASNMEAYIKKTIDEWKEIKKEKEMQRSIYEDMVTSDDWRYYGWHLKDGNLKNLLKTKWNQWPIYNDIVERMGYAGCPAGCGPVAIAQILAFHQLPKSYYCRIPIPYYKAPQYQHIVERVPELKSWDGVYNWKEILKREKIEDLSNEGRLHLGVLLYNIGEVGSATYSIGKTGMSSSGAKRCFKNFGFKYGNFSSYGSYGYISPMKRKGRIGRIGSRDRETSRKPTISAIGYNFAGVKVSIDNKAPVLVSGRSTKKVEKKSAWWWAWEWEEISYENGHFWVVDGYCRLLCTARNKRTGETKNIETNYVHCNVGWGGINNGYYIDELFTFNKATANAEDHQIRSKYGTSCYYQYNIRMFNDVVPR